MACDQIFIRKLRVPAFIGIYPIEQEQMQDIYLDLDCSFDSTPAALSDNIYDTLNYEKICKCMSEYISSRRFNLMEKLAEDLVQLLFREFPIQSLRLKILKKPFDIKNARFVGLVIERKSENYPHPTRDARGKATIIPSPLAGEG